MSGGRIRGVEQVFVGTLIQEYSLPGFNSLTAAQPKNLTCQITSVIFNENHLKKIVRLLLMYGYNFYN